MPRFVPIELIRNTLQMPKDRLRKKLYQGERLQVNLPQYIETLKVKLERLSEHHRRSEWEQSQIDETTQRELRQANYEAFWIRRFQGKIPQNWKDWSSVSDDIEKAKRLHVNLEPDLLDAAISHPNVRLGLMVSENQILSDEQVGIFIAVVKSQFENPIHQESFIKDLFKNQVKLGKSSALSYEAMIEVTKAGTTTLLQEILAYKPISLENGLYSINTIE